MCLFWHLSVKIFMLFRQNEKLNIEKLVCYLLMVREHLCFTLRYFADGGNAFSFYFYFNFHFKRAVNLKNKESIWCGLKSKVKKAVSWSKIIFMASNFFMYLHCLVPYAGDIYGPVRAIRTCSAVRRGYLCTSQGDPHSVLHFELAA